MFVLYILIQVWFESTLLELLYIVKILQSSQNYMEMFSWDYGRHSITSQIARLDMSIRKLLFLLLIHIFSAKTITLLSLLQFFWD